MTAARKTQNGARAGARRASSNTRKAPARASGRTASSPAKRTTTAKRTTNAKSPATRKKTPVRTPARARADRRAITIILIGTLVAASWMLYPVLRLQYQQQREKSSLEQELAGLKERNGTLRAQVDRLKTPAGVEQAARENLGLVKEGEQVYVVTDGEATRAATPEIGEQTRSITASETSVWLRVLDVVFGVR